MSGITQSDFDALLEAARAARERAYAPYSEFSVGAAVLAGSGRIYPGCNVENASYGLTLCAERVAISSAVAAGEREFAAIAIVTQGTAPASPCGACRQFLVEFNPEMAVVLENERGDRQSFTAGDLLPGFFRFPG